MEFCFGEMHFQGVVLRDDTNRCIVYTAKYPINMSNISQSLGIRKVAKHWTFRDTRSRSRDKTQCLSAHFDVLENEFCKVCGSELPEEINLIILSPQSE